MTDRSKEQPPGALCPPLLQLALKINSGIILKLPIKFLLQMLEDSCRLDWCRKDLDRTAYEHEHISTHCRLRLYSGQPFMRIGVEVRVH